LTRPLPPRYTPQPPAVRKSAGGSV
jgi:hypothetical protein